MDSEQQKIEDAELCERFKNGDQSAFAKLYENNRKDCMSLLLSSNVKYADAEDVVQRSFLKVYKRLIHLKNNDSFKGWLFKICMNSYKDLYKYRARRNEHIVPKFNEDYTLEKHIDKKQSYDILPSDNVQKLEDSLDRKEIIRNTLESLPKAHAKVITMHYIENKQYKQIGEELNIPIGTVMSRLHYAKKKFVKAIESI